MGMPTTSGRLEVETIGRVTVASFRDERIVADDVIAAVSDELDRLVEDGQRRQILLNFGRVKAFSSTALGVLLNLRKKLATVRGRLKICCVHGDLMELFTLHRPNKAPPLFEVYPEEQDALDAFSAKTA